MRMLGTGNQLSLTAGHPATKDSPGLDGAAGKVQEQEEKESRVAEKEKKARKKRREKENKTK